MHCIECLCCRWPWVIPKHVKPAQFLHFALPYAICIFVIGNSKDYKFDVQVECASHSLRTTSCPWQGRGLVMWPITKFWGCDHITGTAEPKVVKFCTRVNYINSNKRMTYHQQKGRGYGHVTLLKFCHLLWCSASRGFVSDNRDSWATCL